MTDDDPEYGPNVEALTACKDTSMKRLCATMIYRLFDVFEKSAGDSKDMERASKEMRQWLAQLVVIDGHEGPVKVSDMEAALERLVAERQRIRGDKPSKAPPPKGEGPLGGVH